MCSSGSSDLSANFLIGGPCMRCSVNFGSISSQKPAYFSPDLPSSSMTHRHTELWKRQGSASVSLLIKVIYSYLS